MARWRCAAGVGTTVSPPCWAATATIEGPGLRSARGGPPPPGPARGGGGRDRRGSRLGVRFRPGAPRPGRTGREGGDAMSGRAVPVSVPVIDPIGLAIPSKGHLYDGIVDLLKTAG